MVDDGEKGQKNNSKLLFLIKTVRNRVVISYIAIILTSIT